MRCAHLRLARELLDGHNLVKLEVLGDPQSLYPNVIETIAAAKKLVAEGFQVMVYTSDDPIIARQLEDIGCVAIMPLASLIGSGHGHTQPVEFATHHGARASPDNRRCGGRHGLGCRDSNGTGLRGSIDEHGDRRGATTGIDGKRNEAGS